MMHSIGQLSFTVIDLLLIFNSLYVIFVRARSPAVLFYSFRVAEPNIPMSGSRLLSSFLRGTGFKIKAVVFRHRTF